MSYIVRINIGCPIGQKALQTVPEMVLQIEEIRSLPGKPWKIIYWASGDNFEKYEAALGTDPTITGHTCLTELPDRRLYRIILSEQGQHHTVHPIAVNEDIVNKSITMTAESVEYFGRIPSRDALFSLRNACREKNRSFELISIYEQKPTENDGGFSN